MLPARVRKAVRRGEAARLVATCIAAAAALTACGDSSASSVPRNVPSASPSGDGTAMDGMNGMSGMSGMDMGGTGDDMPGMGQPSDPRIAAAVASDDGLRGSVGGYSYVADSAAMPAGTAAPFTFHVTDPSGKVVTRFQPYEGQLLVFYVIRTDLTDFRRLTVSMRDDGTWTAPMPALTPGSYRTYITFAAPDSSAGTPLSYSLSQPLAVPGALSAGTLPAAAGTSTVDGYTLRLTGSPSQGRETDLGIAVTKNAQPVQQFDRLLDGYAHVTAFHSGDTAFARALSTGRSAGGPSGAGALTAKILFGESGAWRLFVEFETSGVEHVASFTVEVP